jgi:hypothetical protein
MRRFLAAGVVVTLGVTIVAIAIGALSLSGPKSGRDSAETASPPGSSDASASADPTADPATSARTPVLVELFTSEGCSSCPPADAVLARLEKTQPIAGAEVIALSFHVDYWNYIGWADPFSSAQFSERQGEYARAYGKDGVYTPQMIVDGVREFPGGNGNLATETITKAARTPKATLRFSREKPGAEGVVRLGVKIADLPPMGAGGAAYVLLAVTESDLSTDVRRGENSGRRLSHVGVVRRLTTLGPVTGGDFAVEASIPIERGWRRENLRAVVFAQESGSRRVLAAGSLKLFE